MSCIEDDRLRLKAIQLKISGDHEVSNYWCKSLVQESSREIAPE
jgi:hypothetical protein